MSELTQTDQINKQKVKVKHIKEKILTLRETKMVFETFRFLFANIEKKISFSTRGGRRGTVMNSYYNETIIHKCDDMSARI